MRSKRKQIDSQSRDFKEFELEPLMKFNEMQSAEAQKILKKSNIDMSEEEVADILVLLHMVVKITLKELFSAEE
ncbi:hypothetical protein ASG01_13830 [Chryseobacterium sp. Leaf180]|uniref:hypothetical protein n=1 Tax=Chryseobacterium sp. Leaf180 TaxID=1736289 RepID=UPI0006FD9D7D|nr:hypothetical protein [Chryseobacterium sp. Leaf180]KQR91449.1 hypothetical protein ASG01_13830 [Chryseobacterium sp. Leaf180]